MCGVLGIFNRDSAVTELYEGLIALQHRGQDSAGIITYDEMFHLKKGNGLVSRVFNEKNLARLTGRSGIGHVRYPTIGLGSIEDAQPFFVNAPFGIALVHNGNVTNYFDLRKDLANNSFRQLNSFSDAEAILNVFADELTKTNIKTAGLASIFQAVSGVFKRVNGSYSVVALIANKGMLAFRDPHGIKPLIFGQKDNSFAFASESAAFDLLGYKIVRDVKPGEVIFISRKCQIYSKIIQQKTHTPCIFEWVYFARPDSIIDGIGVYEARFRLGKNLGEECLRKGLKPDVVIPVPDTARAAATSLAQVMGVDEREGLIKNRYIARTFIMPRTANRGIAVRQKLNPIRSEIYGRKVLIVDDSIVRGTTAKEIVSLVREAGAKEIYYGVTSPPLKYPCVYGIDMMTRGEFIARKSSVETIRKLIGADVLIYQSFAGLIDGVSGGDKKRSFCTACFSGEYPTRITQKELRRMECDRTRVTTI
uniref:Amidophosphoribosyltransferase n=1 Tax=candidate division WOR-3 bacterium TaxID=2052148 RepID=A0A7C6E9L8_UNCW3